MPLWTIYHPDTIFTTQQEKDSLAASITASYDTIPSFYVVITFHPLPSTSFYRSGKPISQPFIRFVIHHLARQTHDHPEGLEAGFARGRLLIDRAVEKHMVEKGYSWEYSILEEDRGLWKIDGLVPPPFGGEVMGLWKRVDRAVPY